MMPSVFPSHNASPFMPQPSASHGGEEAERVEENNCVFAWIDEVVNSRRHISETKTTTSPTTDDLIDLSTTNLLLPGAVQEFYL
ncbi:hypothetical protein L873DRAFT_1817497 [Choiromyces venosus 120613-1]|uniref:Uncharacterized protein n=1 Tax=Choiromyces venosus 120613-1 TaxID=1336337 RepID=A0A3N4J5G9_9PEZI|nr:hypothetical protein L873DRAFT_1817497 [Choiromyces venosus 120613-1]